MSDITNVIQRGKDNDLVTNITAQNITSTPNMSVLVGMHFESLGIRVLRSDAAGRLLVNPSVTSFDIVNATTTNTMQTVLVGSPVFRRVIFYVFNANANIQFQKSDLSFTGILTVVPNVPVTVEGVFVVAQAQSTTLNVPASLQVIVGNDPTLSA